MKRIYLIGTLLIFAFSVQSQTKKSKSTFRIVGYYSLASAMKADLETVPFDKLTHINLYFLNPDTAGNFNQDLSAIIPFVKAAHAHHVKVLPSIAGGGDHSYYHNLLKDDKRAKLINDLLLITLKYNFDGIDVDIEVRSEEHTSELQSLMRISYAVFCLKNNIHHVTKISTAELTIKY